MPLLFQSEKSRRISSPLFSLFLYAGCFTVFLPAGAQTPSPSSTATFSPTSTPTSSPTVTLTPTSTPKDAVWTQHNNNQRTGVFDCEPTLNPTTVSRTERKHPFHRIARFPVSDSIYAQPLYLPRVEMEGQAHPKNVLFVATTDCNVYAFDADADHAVTLWWKHLVEDGESPTSGGDFQCQAYSGGIQSPDFITGSMGYFDKNIGGDGLIGILGTPVIDRSNGILYVIVRTTDNGGNGVEGAYRQRLWALDIRHQGQPVGEPFLIPKKPTQPDDMGEFRAMWQNQRAALALSPDKNDPSHCTVYAAWAGECDTDLYHGWVMAFHCGKDGISLAARFNDTPDSDLMGEGGGIWQAGQGPALDEQGNLYVMTGNGDFNIYQPGGRDYGNSFLKLSPDLKKVDYFTPSNQIRLDQTDYDLGSAGPVLISRGPSEPDLLLGAGKEAKFFLLNTANLGQYDCAGNGAALQTAFVTIGALLSDYGTPGETPQEGNSCITNHIHGGSVCWATLGEEKGQPVTNREIFVMAENDVVRAYQLNKDCTLPLGTPTPYTQPVTAVVPRLLYGESGQPAAVIPSFAPFQVLGQSAPAADFKRGEGLFNVAQPSEMGYTPENPDEPLMKDRISVGMPGGMLSLSYDGKDPKSAILWVSYPDEDAYIPHVGGRPDPKGTLVAYKALEEEGDGSVTVFGGLHKMLKEIWASDDDPKDAVGNYAKYVPPTVANGRVYIATSKNSPASGGILVYGLEKTAR